jgi:hypothetical protein
VSFQGSPTRHIPCLSSAHRPVASQNALRWSGRNVTLSILKAALKTVFTASLVNAKLWGRHRKFEGGTSFRNSVPPPLLTSQHILFVVGHSLPDLACNYQSSTLQSRYSNCIPALDIISTVPTTYLTN